MAVKKLHRNRLDEENLRAFRDEFELQLSLRHPNVLQIIGGSWNLEDANVHRARGERGWLRGAALQGADALQPVMGQAQAADGVRYCAGDVVPAQAEPTCHSPRPGRTSSSTTGTTPSSPTGCSREVNLEKTMEFKGTPIFMAPELLRRERYKFEKVDVWSFACVLECRRIGGPPPHPARRSRPRRADPSGREDMLRPKTGCPCARWRTRVLRHRSEHGAPSSRCSRGCLSHRSLRAARIPTGPPLLFSTERPLAHAEECHSGHLAFAEPSRDRAAEPRGVAAARGELLGEEAELPQRQHSDLHGLTTTAWPPRPRTSQRLHEREASIRRHTQHLRTQQVARRRKSQDADGAVSFVTKLRPSSRATSHASSSAASGQRGLEPGSTAGQRCFDWKAADVQASAAAATLGHRRGR